MFSLTKADVLCRLLPVMFGHFVFCGQFVSDCWLIGAAACNANYLTVPICHFKVHFQSHKAWCSKSSILTELTPRPCCWDVGVTRFNRHIGRLWLFFRWNGAMLYASHIHLNSHSIIGLLLETLSWKQTILTALTNFSVFCRLLVTVCSMSSVWWRCWNLHQ